MDILCNIFIYGAAVVGGLILLIVLYGMLFLKGLLTLEPNIVSTILGLRKLKKQALRDGKIRLALEYEAGEMVMTVTGHEIITEDDPDAPEICHHDFIVGKSDDELRKLISELKFHPLTYLLN